MEEVTSALLPEFTELSKSIEKQYREFKDFQKDQVEFKKSQDVKILKLKERATKLPAAGASSTSISTFCLRRI